MDEGGRERRQTQGQGQGGQVDSGGILDWRVFTLSDNISLESFCAFTASVVVVCSSVSKTKVHDSHLVDEQDVSIGFKFLPFLFFSSSFSPKKDSRHSGYNNNNDNNTIIT